MLPTYQFRVGPTTIAAGGDDTTSLEGRNGRFIGSPSAGVAIKITGSATGLTAEVQIGQREVTQRSAVPPEAAANLGPNFDTPVFAQGVGVQGEEIFVRIFNPTVGGLDYIYDFFQKGFAIAAA